MHVRVLEEFANRYHASDNQRSLSFDPSRAYLVQSIERAPEVGGGFIVLAGDHGEIHWVESRHVRCVSEGDSAVVETMREAVSTH